MHCINMHYIKWVSIFLNQVNILLEIQKLIQFYLTMQQRATGADTSSLKAKPDLDNLKGQVDKTDINKLKNVPPHFTKVSNVVDNDASKNSV